MWQHKLRGSYRPDRHGPIASSPVPESVPRARDVSLADRRRTLFGLPRDARRLANGLLDEFQGWDLSSLTTLRAYALSCVRLAELDTKGDIRELHREIRVNCLL